MFVIAHRSRHFLALAATAAPLLHHHDLLKPFEVDIQDPYKLTTVHQIRETLALRSEETGEETHTCVVFVHFVLLGTHGDFFLQEGHHLN